MRNESSISVTKMSTVFNFFEVNGIKREKALETIGISPSILESPDNRLTADEVYKILQEAMRLANNESIGLYLGELLSKGFSNILGYVLMNCRTLGDASEKYCRYEKIVDETSITDVRIEGSFAIVSITTIDRILLNNRQFSDYKISGLLSYIKMLTGKSINLNEVHFTHRKPKDISEYKRIFQCPVYFEKQVSALVFDNLLLNLPIIEPNNNLLDLFEKKAQETIELYDGDETYSKKVTRIILKEMNRDMPSIKVVARKLAISVRSLQTYLNKEQTSFTKISNDIRKDIALQCLNDNNASIDEIAYIIGFSEASAFHRAFKKWTSLTPSEFRVAAHSSYYIQ
ncbi:AraC family transcriptional regulator [Desulfosporosinus fructosivorans]